MRTHEAVAAFLSATPPGASGAVRRPQHAAPRALRQDVLTFAHDSAGRLRPERGERWDRAERALVHGLRERGWVDAFRALHGYGEREASCFTGPRRLALDHVLVHALRPVASAYAHDWRRSGLSDHSALVVDLERS